MSRAPYLLDRARDGYRLGHGRVLDHMFFDGLKDAYDNGRLMGTYAEDCAEAFQFTREMQDEFAIASLTRARRAAKDGIFSREIVPVRVNRRGTETRDVVDDEPPKRASVEKIKSLKPAFDDSGSVTAANSSSICDGAAALTLMRQSEAERLGIRPRAAILAQVSHAQAPSKFTTAPVGAIKKLMKMGGWSIGDIDLFEINEAFAVVTMAAMHELAIPHEKVNVHGGACALGHPIGATGARIVVTLLHALEKYDVKRGIATACIGGGEATAIAIERIN